MQRRQRSIRSRVVSALAGLALVPAAALAPATVFFAAAALVPAVALADGVPMPVGPGEVYLEAGLGYGRLEGGDSQLLRSYVNDEPANGSVTLTDSQGFLASFDTDSSGWQLLPAVTLGFATKRPWFGGAPGRVTRLEIFAEAARRDARDTIGTVDIPQTGYTIDVGGTPTDTGLVAHMGPISGTQFDTGGSATSGSIIGHPNFATIGMDPAGLDPSDIVTMDLEETSGRARLMVFLDEPAGSWVFTRGVGMSVGYTKARYQYAVPFRELSNANPTWDDLLTGVARHDYDFELSSFVLGANAAFAIGYRPIRYFTVFWNGSFMPGVGVTRIQGRQWGFCLQANPCGSANYANVGLDARDVALAYDARTAAGVSLLFYRYVRVTGQAGVFANNASPRPWERPDGGRFMAQLAHQWGYYGRASVMLSY